MAQKRIAAIVSGVEDDLGLRRVIIDVAGRKNRPDRLVIFLSGRENFSDSLISDLLDDSIFVRCMRQSKSSAEAATFGLRLAFAEDVDYFALLHPRHIYRSDYFTVVQSIVEADVAAADQSPRCWNLINQEWLPKTSERPTPFHFRGGLGLSEDEQRAGQTIGAPDTFLLNRQAARILLADCWNHSLYKYGSYDLVWRQTLLAAGVNISLVTTSKPTFVFVEQKQPADNSATSEGKSQESPPQFPEGLRDPALAKTTPLRTLAREQRPDVSIVIPTYNEGDWLFHTVDSLHSLETEYKVEIIVVDDGCTDGSVEKLQVFPDVRIAKTPQPKSGLIVAKNTGGSLASGKYLCFVDSHMLMPQDWLDRLMTPMKQYSSPTLLTCSIIDVMYFGKDSPLAGDHYGYSLSDWTFNVRWHHYGRNKFSVPYRVPLCPGGMSLMTRERFEELGGFCKVFRKWGSEDVEFALRHYCAGGETYSIPGTHVYHYFKNNKTRKPTFSITFAQTAFNAMFVAKTYFPKEDYQRVKAAFLQKAKLHSIVDELESGQFDDYSKSLQNNFVRSFSDWRHDFSKELLAFEAARPDMSAQPQKVGSA